MTSSICIPATAPTTKLDEPMNLTELVKGQDQDLLDRMAPLVRRQSVSLDLASVERIDAAGIAVLIMLYRSAQETGHCFSVSNTSRHVAEMLSLVGLDRILLKKPD